MKQMTSTGEPIAVIVVDLQGDFTEFRKGSLAVPATGKDYIGDVEAATRLLKEAGFLIYGSQDWHPANHVSFYTTHPGRKPGEVIQIDGRTQVLWPPHCVQGTDNAEVIIDNGLFAGFIKKAQDPEPDSYSAFADEEGAETELNSLLKRNNVRKVVIFGLATDYCVKYTAVDGRRRGYGIIVVESLCRGITPETTGLALAEMERVGVVILKTLDLAEIKAL